MLFYTGVRGLPYYLKKKDIPAYTQSRNTTMGIVLLIMGGVFGYISYTVYRELLRLVIDFGATPSLIFQLFPYTATIICLGFLIIGLKYLVEKPSYNQMQEKFLNKYQSNDMVNVKELHSVKSELGLLLVFGIAIGLLVISLVVPIYQITGEL